jgi:LytS/YehU family sensor histidine kinase
MRLQQIVFPIFNPVKNRIVAHIVFWLAYWLFESNVEFAWLTASSGTTPILDRWWMALFGELVQLVAKIPLCYFVFSLATQWSRFRPAVRILLGLAAFAVAVVLQRYLIVEWILPHIYHDEVQPSFMFNWRRMMATFLDLVFIVGIAVAVKLFRVSQRSREKEKALVKERMEAELKFLRTQTNPHFLFNTLNNIYALARKKSDDTADVVMKLSKLLRFMLYESRNNTIRISDELRVLKDYIELERIRYNERLVLKFETDIDDETHPIAPLILLPFVENAFKHGASEARFNSFIHIGITLKKGTLSFMVENSKEEGNNEHITENIGLSNVRRQLQLMYPAHRLEMQVNKETFKVDLKINLDRYEGV